MGLKLYISSSVRQRAKTPSKTPLLIKNFLLYKNIQFKMTNSGTKCGNQNDWSGISVMQDLPLAPSVTAIMRQPRILVTLIHILKKLLDLHCYIFVYS